MTNIKKQPGFNRFQWNDLTEGKLLMLARLTKLAADNGNALANDCYHEILNFFYEYEFETYQYIESHVKGWQAQAKGEGSKAVEQSGNI